MEPKTYKVHKCLDDQDYFKKAGLIHKQLIKSIFYTSPVYCGESGQVDFRLNDETPIIIYPKQKELHELIDQLDLTWSVIIWDDIKSV